MVKAAGFVCTSLASVHGWGHNECGLVWKAEIRAHRLQYTVLLLVAL